MLPLSQNSTVAQGLMLSGSQEIYFHILFFFFNMKENLIENTNIQKLLGEKLPNIKMSEGVMNANSSSKYTKDLKGH